MVPPAATLVGATLNECVPYDIIGQVDDRGVDEEGQPSQEAVETL
jgi:hypothetical protein